ncbi:Transcription initiation protein spt3 [Balamuthia mandrillaris]
MQAHPLSDGRIPEEAASAAHAQSRSALEHNLLLTARKRKALEEVSAAALIASAASPSPHPITTASIPLSSSSSSSPTMKRARRMSSSSSSSYLHSSHPFASAPSPNVSYLAEVKDMMYTFGDVRNVLDETALLVESVVRQYLCNLIKQAQEVASLRGGGTSSSSHSSALELSDVLFLLRRERSTLSRLQQFLRWRELRIQTAASSSAAESSSSSSSSSSSVLTTVSPEIVSTAAAASSSTIEKQQTTTSTANNSDNKQKTTTSRKQANKKNDRRSTYTMNSGGWRSFFVESLKSVCSDDEAEEENAELEKEEEEKGTPPEFEKQHLRLADELTKAMSKEEYLQYTECRQASFTFKKSKKFKQWLFSNILFSSSPSSSLRITEETMEVLGYLAWEKVGGIVQEALQVKRQMEEAAYRGRTEKNRSSLLNVKLELMAPTSSQMKSGDEEYEKTPLLPMHIRETMRRANSSVALSSSALNLGCKRRCSRWLAFG